MRLPAWGWSLLLALSLASCHSGEPADPVRTSPEPVQVPSAPKAAPEPERPSWIATHRGGSGLACVGHAPDEVVATVDGEDLKLQQLVDNSLEWWGDKTLEEMIFRTLMDHYARKLGAENTPEEMAQYAEKWLTDLDASVKASSNGRSSLAQELSQRNETVEGYKAKLVTDENFQRHMLVQKMILYDDMCAEKVEVQDILVETPEKAKEVEEKLSKQMDFARLAADESIDARGAQNGGKIPAFAWGLGPFGIDFDRAAFALAPGQLSQPVHDARRGYHVIRCIAKTPARAAWYKDLRGEIWKRMMTDPPSENDVAHWITRMKEINKDKVDVRWKYGVSEHH